MLGIFQMQTSNTKLKQIPSFKKVLRKTMGVNPHFKNENISLNINIYSYLETSGGLTSNLFLNVVLFFNAIVNYTSVAA